MKLLAWLLLLPGLAGAQNVIERQDSPNGGPITPTSVTATTGTISNLAVGGIVFSSTPANGRLAVDASNLFWDDTNNRLGVGTNSPLRALDVNGSANVRGNFDVGPGSATFYGNVDAGSFVLKNLTGRAYLSLNSVTNAAIGIDFQDGNASTVGIGVCDRDATNTCVYGTNISGGSTVLITGSQTVALKADSNQNVSITSSTWAGTPIGTGTQLYRCNGGTFAGNIVYGAAGLCTGGTAVAIPVWVP